MSKQVEVGYGNVRRVVFGDGAPLAFIGGHVPSSLVSTRCEWANA